MTHQCGLLPYHFELTALPKDSRTDLAGAECEPSTLELLDNLLDLLCLSHTMNWILVCECVSDPL